LEVIQMVQYTQYNFQESHMVYLVLLAVIITISAIRTTKGRKYSPLSVLSQPLIYLVLGGILVFSNQATLLMAFLGTITGFVIGIIFGRGVLIFRNDGELYYKRSIFVYLIWLSLYLLRALINILSINQTSIEVVDILIMFSSGLLIGESLNVIKKARKYMSENL
jgi:hypothetical protein